MQRTRRRIVRTCLNSEADEEVEAKRIEQSEDMAGGFSLGTGGGLTIDGADENDDETTDE